MKAAAARRFAPQNVNKARADKGRLDGACAARYGYFEIIG